MKTAQNSTKAFERISGIFLEVVKAFNPFDLDLTKKRAYEAQLIRFMELWTEDLWFKKKIGEEDCKNCVFLSFYPCDSSLNLKLQHYLPHIVKAVWLEWVSV